MQSGSNYVKIGLYGPENYDQTFEVIDAVVKTIHNYTDNIAVVSCGYSDAYKIVL